ncbi:hypothetical protein BJ508DRAFT_337021 [Ascobolus immersus RN42]|nr:hypothetical protein BJ508DRAFT_337021 [Ascobolus immersus RN42]
MRELVWSGKGTGVLCSRDPTFFAGGPMASCFEPFLHGGFNGNVARRCDFCGWDRLMVVRDGGDQCWFVTEEDGIIRTLMDNGYKVAVAGEWVSKKRKLDHLGGTFSVWEADIRWEVSNDQ